MTGNGVEQSEGRASASAAAGRRPFAAGAPPEPSRLPLATRFELGAEITAEQERFLETHGFIVFERVARPDEVAVIAAEVERVGAAWVTEGRRQVNGIPLFWGADPEGRPFIQRLCFTSAFSEPLRRFVRDPRFEPIRRMFGDDARVGDDEKDGVVCNRYLNCPGSVHGRLGWHTDGLRDLFYGRLPGPMLNVGLHLDAIRAVDGGLRVVPGSHLQGFWSMCFAKPYFVDHRPDPTEFTVETEPGDLTVHDGRLWHRVERSGRTGWASLRRSIYVPYLTGPYEPKDEGSPTPLYHRLGSASRALQAAVARLGFQPG
jgi:hypothetical protein